MTDEPTPGLGDELDDDDPNRIAAATARAVLDHLVCSIVDDPDGWTEATRSKAFKKRFGAVDGDSLKRPPAGIDPDHPLIDDLKRKSFFATQDVDPKLATTARFIGEVEKAFVALVPMMRFLTEALGLSFALDD